MPNKMLYILHTTAQQPQASGPMLVYDWPALNLHCVKVSRSLGVNLKTTGDNHDNTAACRYIEWVVQLQQHLITH